MSKNLRRLTLLFVTVCVMIIMAVPAFAEDKAELTVTKAHIDNNMGEVTETQEPLSNWVKLTHKNGIEIKVVTDNSVVTLKDADGNDKQFLECWLTEPVRRDEVLSIKKADSIITDDEGNDLFINGYGVLNDEVQEMKYTDTYPVTQNYIISINGHFFVSDDYMEEEAIVLPDFDNNPDTETWIHINFEYGLEEQEVIDAIDKLPDAVTVKLEDEAAIVAARTAYDGLEKWKTTAPADPDIQKKVTNYSKLVDCENALAVIKDEEAAKDTAKTEAGTAIEIANAISAADYTEESYKAVTDAKAALEEVLAKTDATSTEISDAVKALNDAIDKLEKKQTTVTKKKQPMTVKPVLKKVSFKKLKKAKKVVSKAIIVKKNQGSVTYKKLKGSSAKLTINKKTGKITVKKKTKKGTYKIIVKVSAKGNAKYKAGSKTVTVKIQVK